MRPTEHRTYSTALQIRAVGDGLTISGLAAPFDTPTEISDSMGTYVETIAPGAFARTIAERADRVKVYAQHDTGQLPVGKAVSLTESRDGLRAVLQLSNTSAGRDLATLARDGVVTGLSIGFQAIRDSWNTQRAERRLTEIRLQEISLTPFPAYATAQVTSVRSEPADLERPFLEVARRRLDLHTRSF